MIHRPANIVGEEYGTEYPAMWISTGDDLLSFRNCQLLATAKFDWYPQNNYMNDNCFFIRILNRFHIEIFNKYLYFRKKLTFNRTRYRQNQHLWSHFRDIMSPENQGVFQLPKELTMLLLCHSSTAFVCGSFARHSSAFSGLFQAS